MADSRMPTEQSSQETPDFIAPYDRLTLGTGRKWAPCRQGMAVGQACLVCASRKNEGSRPKQLRTESLPGGRTTPKSSRVDTSTEAEGKTRPLKSLIAVMIIQSDTLDWPVYLAS